MWVTALWYASLVASLSTALVAVLVKQWLHQYMNLPSGTAKHRSHVRQFRYSGFQAWKVLLIVGLLPVLMHISLALFLIGLVIFLSNMASPIAWMIGAILTIVYVAYVGSLILPMVHPKCPYRTPLSNMVFAAYSYSTRLSRGTVRRLFRRGEESEDKQYTSKNLRSTSLLKEAEARIVKRNSSDLTVDSLHWLFCMSSNPTVQSIVIESVGALPMSSRSNPKVNALFGVNSEMYTTFLQLLKTSLHPTELGRRPNDGVERKAARLLRYDLHVDSCPQMRVRVRVERSDSLEFAASALASRSGSWKGSTDTFWVIPFLAEVLTTSSPPAFPLAIWLRLIENATKGRYFLYDRAFAIILGNAVVTALSHAMESPAPRDEDTSVVFADAVALYPNFRSQLISTLSPLFEEHNKVIYNPLVTPHLRLSLAILSSLSSRGERSTIIAPILPWCGMNRVNLHLP